MCINAHPQFTLLHYPSLAQAAQAVHVTDGEIYGASFNQTRVSIVLLASETLAEKLSKLALLTEFNILIYALPAVSEEKTISSKGKQKESTTSLELVRTVTQPTLPGVHGGATFRAVK